MKPHAKVPALAKINLSLRVLHKRPDNYHELRTVFQTISLADSIDITFQSSREMELDLTGNVEIPNNLILRAAHLVLEQMGVTARVEFKLEKHIPMGGGLGGGSTDAAAVLLALPALAGKKVARAELLRIATELGSDVPFFLLGGTALGLGRGEELYPFPAPPRAFGLLVAPDLHISTPEAFRALAREPAAVAPPEILREYSAAAWDLLESWPGFCQNDFETPAFAQHPELLTIHRNLVKTGAQPARLTGSGAALYGLYPTRAQASAARGAFPNQRTFLFTLVNRARYRTIWCKALG
jgi:4-diphosphocytidyl-2-C-methyl-D-erythritol kinase